MVTSHVVLFGFPGVCRSPHAAGKPVHTLNILDPSLLAASAATELAGLPPKAVASGLYIIS